MASYESLGDVKEKGTVFVLRSAYAFLFATALFCAATTLYYIHAGSTQGTYLAALSAIINGVAAWHYYEIVKVRMGEAITKGSEWKIDALRHGDWVVTMPLLVLKLHALVGSGSDHNTLLSTVDLAAFISALPATAARGNTAVALPASGIGCPLSSRASAMLALMVAAEVRLGTTTRAPSSTMRSPASLAVLGSEPCTEMLNRC